MTIREMKIGALNTFPHGTDHVLAIEVLLANVLGCGREELFLNSERQVPGIEEKLFLEKLSRYAGGEPVAYLVGSKEFHGLDFTVDRRVLIPRPETEHLVDEVIDFVSSQNRKFAILDVGTGSGCIGVTLAKKLVNVSVTATDVSSDALEVARLNAARHGVKEKIEFVQSDLLSGVVGPFDVVVANLPYIGVEKFRFVSREALEYEPHVALFGGCDGLRLYEKLFTQLGNCSWRPQLLVGEFGFLQGDDMTGLLERFFPKCWRVKKDYASIDRMFVVGFSPEVKLKQ